MNQIGNQGIWQSPLLPIKTRTVSTAHALKSGPTMVSLNGKDERKTLLESMASSVILP